MTFKEEALWALFKLWNFLSIPFYRASGTVSKQINGLLSAPSKHDGNITSLYIQSTMTDHKPVGYRPL